MSRRLVDALALAAALAAVLALAAGAWGSPADPTYRIVLLADDVTPAEGLAVARVAMSNPDAVVVVCRCQYEGRDDGPDGHATCRLPSGETVCECAVRDRAEELWPDRDVLIVLLVPAVPEGPPPESL